MTIERPQSTPVKLTVETKPAEGSLFLRMGVLSGEGDNGLTFELDTTGPTLILNVKRPDQPDVQQTLSLSDLTTAWVNAIVREPVADRHDEPIVVKPSAKAGS